jgi:hypothetical protein
VTGSAGLLVSRRGQPFVEEEELAEKFDRFQFHLLRCCRKCGEGGENDGGGKR